MCVGVCGCVYASLVCVCVCINMLSYMNPCKEYFFRSRGKDSSEGVWQLVKIFTTHFIVRLKKCCVQLRSNIWELITEWFEGGNICSPVRRRRRGRREGEEKREEVVVVVVV